MRVSLIRKQINSVYELILKKGYRLGINTKSAGKKGEMKEAWGKKILNVLLRFLSTFHHLSAVYPDA